MDLAFVLDEENVCQRISISVKIRKLLNHGQNTVQKSIEVLYLLDINPNSYFEYRDK